MTNAAAALSSPTSLYVRKALLDLNEKRAAVRGAGYRAKSTSRRNGSRACEAGVGERGRFCEDSPNIEG